MIHRRQFVRALCLSVLASPIASLAQRPKVPRVGILSPETLAGSLGRVDALREGLRDYGYVEGKNMVIEMRSADGNYDRLPELAAELTRLRVDVIVAVGTKAVSAAMAATTTIPIVDPVMGDPVALGLGKSLARPGGNVTGSAQFGPEAYAKRLQYLKEAVPSITRVGALMNPANAASAMQVQAMRDSAKALNLELQVIEVRTPSEFGSAFAAMAKGRVDAIMISTDTLFRANYIEIADLAGKQKLPSAGPKEFAVAGGLIGYGVDDAGMYRHAAYFVDKILKGAKPDQLPIEQATKLQLVLNFKTAKALGISIPQSLLARADDVLR